MSQYKGKNRNYFDLVESFKTKIVENPGNTDKLKNDKYFDCLQLIADLEVSFQFYYEYKMLRDALKDYTDVLSKQLNKPKIRIFTPTDIFLTQMVM